MSDNEFDFMPSQRFDALVEEYHKDIQTAKVCSTIMNASGKYRDHINPLDLIGEERPTENAVSANTLASTLKAISAAKGVKKEASRG